MLAGIFGAKDGVELPSATYPYFKPPMTRDEERAMRDKTEAALVWNGTGYSWKE